MSVADAMSEAQLDTAIRNIIRDLRLYRYHTFNSRKSDPGFPDLVIAGISGLLFRELKREGSKPTRVQQAWLDVLAAAGADVSVWRPSDLLSGRVAHELAALAGRRVRA